MKKVFITALCCIGLSISTASAQIKNYNLDEESGFILDESTGEMYSAFYGKEYKLDKKEFGYGKDGYMHIKGKDWSDNYKEYVAVGTDYVTSRFAEKTANPKKYDLENFPPFYRSEIIKSITASSYLIETVKGQTVNYTADNIGKIYYWGSCKCHPKDFNRFNHIPWVEGKEDYGIGETITVELKENVYGFKVLNGYVDLENTTFYKENSRVKIFKVEDLENGESKTLSLKDVVQFTDFLFEKPTSKFRLTILDVYKGSKYKDTCVSGLVFITNSNYKQIEEENQKRLADYLNNLIENKINNPITDYEDEK